MSDREIDPQDQTLDPPENTEENEMNLVQPETQRKLDPPENTEERPE